MDKSSITKLVKQLRRRGVVFETGLSDKEVETIQKKFGFLFPPDLLRILQYALPVSEGFPNWRKNEDSSLWEKVIWPTEGLCFDIQHNKLWMANWGEQPENLQDALEKARQEIAKAPTLIPIYSHRYISEEPAIEGNPVFSVHQSDIVYYANDLCSYFAKEFGSPPPEVATKVPRLIFFWGDLAG